MKVRSSVKRICPKCKVVRRKGVVRVICENPETQTAPGIRKSMARISGVDLPQNKQIWIGLTYIYGIGRSRSKDILAKAEVPRGDQGQRSDRG